MSIPFPIKAFTDNYIWAFPIGDRRLAVVDPGEAGNVIEYCKENDLSLSFILITHHHMDHIGGIADLLSAFPDCKVYGPAEIPGVTTVCKEGDRFSAGTYCFEVMSIPGHTLDHLAYYVAPWLFCGDTLFSVGCGRLFEGTAEQMHKSLSRLAALPEETYVFCAHEYTIQNMRFAMTQDPDNAELCAAYHQAVQQQKEGLPTLPSTIAREKAINPFLRVSQIPRSSGTENYSAVEFFQYLREAKDRF